MDPTSRIGDNDVIERSDESLEVEEEKEQDDDDDRSGDGTIDEERKLLDELHGLEEAEEEEYSGPLFMDEEECAKEVEGVDQEEAHNAECDAHPDVAAEIGHKKAQTEIQEENGDKDTGNSDVLGFLRNAQELDEGTPEEQAEFSGELAHFFSCRKMDYRPPKFYGQNLNLLKLWRTVIRLGAYDYVTANKLWRQVGKTFNPPKKCTTVSWSFRVFYERSLLEYERYKLHGGVHSSSGQEGHEHSIMEDHNPANKDSLIQRPARRDAAVRAMQGWHSQKIIETEEEELSKEKTSTVVTSNQNKDIKMGVTKRKDYTNSERVCKTRLINGSRNHFPVSPTQKDEYDDRSVQPSSITSKRQSSTKGHTPAGFSYHLANGVDVKITDEGPVADWVKINVQKAGDCFEVYALVPGLLQEELRIRCEPGGTLMIIGEPEKPNNPWGVTPFRKVIKLPLPIDADQTSAVITLHGQLFIRVPYFGQ